jgi:hypothetical protein
MDASADFVEAVLASPLGVSWLAVLEAWRPGGDGWPATSPVADRAAVAAAVDRVGELSFGAVMRAAVFAGVMESGPWMPDAPDKLAAAYRQAEQRAPIAEALAARFGEELHWPIGRDGQQWFTDGHPWIESIAPLFRDLGEVYGAGEFTTSGLWTATDPPPDVLEEMVGAWEIETGPIQRWWLPVRPEARVLELHRPADWARLVTEYPRLAEPHPGWELPGVNPHPTVPASLFAVPHQRAARDPVRRHLVPDWRSVAQRYDGVHLSWAGFVTSEGCVVDLGEGDVTMLRYWFSERTLWLADVFGEPSPAPDPGIDLDAGSRHWPPRPPRITVDLGLIERLLGRSGRGDGGSDCLPR